ncbi:WhiB family transcriptional regulator [Microbispora sp. NPDC049125]|uniref:WhiB family transcriptional regulator n=1 Tax=Microbispora sp. NPDC049125 TaxID=3154929 RepID=UPI0034674579
MTAPARRPKVVRRTPGEHGFRIHTAVWSGRPWLDDSWQRHGACATAPADVQLAFHGATEGTGDPTHVEIDKAQACCRRCPVAAACIEDAVMRREMKGVWGGVTPRSLRVFQRARAKALREIKNEKGAA